MPTIVEALGRIIVLDMVSVMLLQSLQCVGGEGGYLIINIGVVHLLLQNHAFDKYD